MAAQETLDRYVVISTDTHTGADLYGYKRYLPERLHDEFDRSTDDCRKILADNAARLYRFDLDALAPIAAEIGPTVTEVHAPLEDTGYRAPAAFAYRPFEGGLALERLAPKRG